MMKTRILLTIILMSVFSVGAEDNYSWNIHPKGFGPVYVGMTLRQASKAIGVKMVEVSDSRLDDCVFVRPISGYDGLSFMMLRGKISRADLDLFGDYEKYGVLPMIESDHHVSLGSTIARVKRSYAKPLDILKNDYGETTLTSWLSRKKDFGVMYVVDEGGKTVTQIKGGNDSIIYAEGCA